QLVADASLDRFEDSRAWPVLQPCPVAAGLAAAPRPPGGRTRVAETLARGTGQHPRSDQHLPKQAGPKDATATHRIQPTLETPEPVNRDFGIGGSKSRELG